MLMSDESAGGPHAAPVAVTPPASLSAPEAWGGWGRGAEFKKRETPFRGGEKRNECLWLKEQLQRVADFILAAT